MKIIRYCVSENDSIFWGCLRGDRVYQLDHVDPRSSIFTVGKEVGAGGDVKLLSPCRPGKVVALAINYQGASGHSSTMQEPLVFLKSPESVCGPRDDIVCPFPGVRVWGEAELAIVIGKTLKRADTAEALDGVLGYTMANDVTVDNIDGRDHHLARSKAPDTFCPLGPWIDTDYDPTNKIIEGCQNGELVRRGTTEQRLWKDVQIVSWLSSWMTLNPWDVILTGTPPRVRDRLYLRDGDTYRVRIEGLGEMENTFRSAL